MGVMWMGQSLDGTIVILELPYTDEELEALGGIEGLNALGIPKDPESDPSAVIIKPDPALSDWLLRGGASAEPADPDDEGPRP
jgi:hypothetical protein